jgi:hypothetical protein
MINSLQNIQTLVAFANICINDIIDRKQNNQQKNTSEIVMFVNVLKHQKINIQNY